MATTDISLILTHYGADYVPVSERWSKMRCPFHDDRTASASVNTESGKFRCFACDISGDGIDIVAWKEGIRDFVSAVEYITGRIGVSVNGLRNTAQQGNGGVSDTAGDHKGQRTIFQARKRPKPR